MRGLLRSLDSQVICIVEWTENLEKVICGFVKMRPNEFSNLN